VTTRLRFIDAVRALFLVQGIVFHSLLPFHEAKPWVVSNPDAVYGIAASTEWMHSFRMQGFFLISGLFSWRLLQKTSTSDFLITRLYRLINPLVVVLLTANMWERSIVAEHQLKWAWKSPALSPLYLGALWFLAYLVLFTLALPVMRAAVASSQLLRRLEQWSPERVEYSLPVLLLAGSLLIMLVARTSPEWWHQKQLGFIEPASATMYFGYFMAGVFLARTGHASVLATKPGIGWWIAAVAGWIIVQAVSHASFRGAWTLSSGLVAVYAIAPLRLIFWAVAHAVRGGVPRPVSAIVEASFTVYLLHQLVVVSVASQLAPVPWPPLLKIPFIISTALLLPFVFHRVFVVHSPLLAFLLNGVPAARTRARMQSRSATAAVED
jgi:glucan biosynthesis protein C